MKSDEELMSCYIGNDYQSFLELYYRYRGKIYGYICKRVKNKSDAADIFQEVFRKVHEGRFGFKDEYLFAPWIFTIARNLIVDHIRHMLRKNRSESNIVELGIEFEQSDDQTDLGVLSEREKYVVHLRFFKDETFEFIAKKLNTTPSNSRKILSRAIQTLRRKYVG